ncbi:unnamed protein product [Polarella glacialis]|uniref:Uncharacterized protein n=1 Tax=Polarella glacialis TaxID=89957 RepID=A0A813HN21_POLGL|nr:unnamed protein product [Polarella glacialis]CAE8640009.1 unnamed protein product [Polarella glacialis]
MGVVRQCPNCYELTHEVPLDVTELSHDCQQHCAGAAAKAKEVGAPGGTAQGQLCDSCVISFCSSCARTEFRAGPLVGAGSPLEQGALVVISGLQKAAHLNDQVGFAASFNKAVQRWAVELPCQRPPAGKGCA